MRYNIGLIGGQYGLFRTAIWRVLTGDMGDMAMRMYTFRFLAKRVEGE